MIASKKKNTAPNKSSAGHIRDTLTYILRAGAHSDDAEAVAYARTANMTAGAEQPDLVFSEMMLTAGLSKRVKNPVVHVVLSFHEWEHPRPDQVDEAVQIVLEELGYNGLQCAYALHTDHKNNHVHLAINRVDPSTGTCRSDFNDVVKLHRAIARIEKKQGWQREKRGRFEEIDGEIVRTKIVDDDSHVLSEGAAMIEKKTGLKSAERIAIEDLRPIISSCKSWSELHERLALSGFEYRPKGGGAVIVGSFADGQTEVKASTVSNKFSLKKMEKIFGTFVASTAQVCERRPEPLEHLAGKPEVEQYIDQRIAAKKDLAAIVATHEARLAELKRERAEIYEALRSVPDAEMKTEVLAAFRQVFSEYTIAELERIEAVFSEKVQAGKEVLRNVSDLEVWLSLHCPESEIKLTPPPRTVQPVRRPKLMQMHPASDEKLRAFMAYHEAVGADRYRVTIRKKTGVGFVLGKKEGQPSEGYTPHELIRMMDVMRQEEEKGAHVYLTPLSDTAVHILVDDMDAASLERMKADGFTPSVVLESSPGNFQSVFTVPVPPEIAPEEMRRIGNAISRGLNSRYGDINLSGSIHPHRTPAFMNPKEKYKDSEGRSPVVKIVEKNQYVINERLYQFIGYEHELLTAAAAKPRRRERPQRSSSQGEAEPPMTMTAGRLIYEAHRRDIMRIAGYCSDASRLDSMIAERLVATGHTRAEVTAIMEAGVDRQRHHDWTTYIPATVARAFESPDAQRSIDRLTRYHAQWAELERAAQEQQPEPEEEGPRM